MRYVLFAITAPWSICVGWLVLLFLYAIGAVKDLRWEGTLVLTAVWSDWVVRPRSLPWGPMLNGERQKTALWQYSTTLSRAVAYQPGWRQTPWSRVQFHEHVHVRQVEDAMSWSFLMGVLVLVFSSNWITGAWLGTLIWFLGGASQSVNWLTAWARGGDPYRDSEHELSAYAQTDARGE